MPPEEWTPDKPFPDADDEADVQNMYRKRKRLNYLEEQDKKKREEEENKNKPKKRSAWS